MCRLSLAGKQLCSGGAIGKGGRNVRSDIAGNARAAFDGAGVL